MTNCSLFENELDYVERLLEEDIRNNSAWNQRFFIVSHQAQQEKLAQENSVPREEDEALIEGELLKKEADFAFEAIKKVPGNESSWNYLNG